MSTSDPIRTIVLIGFGLSGVGFTNALIPSLPTSHRLVIVSASECAFYPITTLRASVLQGYEDKVTLPIHDFFGPDHRHRVLKGYTAVKLELNRVLLDKELPDELGGGRALEFDFAVLAMVSDIPPTSDSCPASHRLKASHADLQMIVWQGSSYPTPCRPPPGSTSPSAIALSLTALQSSISSPAVHTVLIAGGGPVGIEMAGEIAYHFPDKKVILVHHGKRLMETGGWKESLGKSLEDQLRQKGVDLRLGEMVDLKGRKTGLLERDERKFDLEAGWVEADFLFVAFGNSPNTSLITSSPTFASLLNDKKQIRILPTFQLASAATDFAFSHIFAIGDITDVEEAKAWVNAQSHGPVAAQNILSLIHDPGKKVIGKGLKTRGPGPNIIVVSCGPDGGAGQVYLGVVMGAWMTAVAKSKTLMYDKFQAAYKAYS